MARLPDIGRLIYVVPRFYEKVHDGIQEQLSISRVRKRLVTSRWPLARTVANAHPGADIRISPCIPHVSCFFAARHYGGECVDDQRVIRNTLVGWSFSKSIGLGVLEHTAFRESSAIAAHRPGGAASARWATALRNAFVSPKPEGVVKGPTRSRYVGEAPTSAVPDEDIPELEIMPFRFDGFITHRPRCGIIKKSTCATVFALELRGVPQTDTLSNFRVATTAVPGSRLPQSTSMESRSVARACRSWLRASQSHRA